MRPRRGPPRPARRSDIAILIPARTALGQLEAALRASGIAYRLDTGSLVYAADEIRALLMALRVVDDPTDELAVVSVLRTPLYGCSDVDLYRWRVQRGGRWNPRAPRPERLEDDDAVWDAMADLEQRIGTRAWLTPSQQLDSLVRDRRVLEAALAGPSPLDALAPRALRARAGSGVDGGRGPLPARLPGVDPPPDRAHGPGGRGRARGRRGRRRTGPAGATTAGAARATRRCGS